MEEQQDEADGSSATHFTSKLAKVGQAFRRSRQGSVHLTDEHLGLLCLPLGDERGDERTADVAAETDEGDKIVSAAELISRIFRRRPVGVLGGGVVRGMVKKLWGKPVQRSYIGK